MKDYLKRSSSTALLLLALTVGSVAYAQDGSPAASSTDGKRQFRADFFAAYSPVTALDMFNGYLDFRLRIVMTVAALARMREMS